MTDDIKNLVNEYLDLVSYSTSSPEEKITFICESIKDDVETINEKEVIEYINEALKSGNTEEAKAIQQSLNYYEDKADTPYYDGRYDDKIENLEKELNESLIAEDRISNLRCGVNEEGDLYFGDDETGYAIPDTKENRQLIADDWLDEVGEDINDELFPDDKEDVIIIDVETFINETYSKEELKKLIGKVYNQQRIENIYRRRKYDQSKLFAYTKCTKCGRTKKVFLSNLIKNPDKYGSCICSDKNVDGKIDYASKLYTNQKILRNNTSGYTGVSFVKSYSGQPYNKWRAYIEVDGVRTYLGDFDSKKDAIQARKVAGEKGVKWYKQNRNKFIKNVRKKTKKYVTSKYRDVLKKTKAVKAEK